MGLGDYRAMTKWCAQYHGGRERALPDRGRRPVSLFAAALALGVLSFAPPAARANDAEIVSLIGKGDSRDTADAPWRPAAVKQKLVAGAFVRTGEMSQMALLLRDRTQVRLNQLSILNIKAVNAGEPPPATRLELPQGRAWSQARPKTPGVAAVKQPSLEVSMPGGTAVIRGTDWELVAEKDGTSIVTVLSGEVEFFNDLGRVAVLPNEQARAAPGKAPVKILLTNAAERVQWVTAYRPQPRRWVKDFSGGLEPIARAIEMEEFAAAMQALAKIKGAPGTDARASLLLADLYLFLGQAADAVTTLAPHAGDGGGDPMAAALLARAHMIAGDLAAAARVLDSAAKRHPDLVEVLLARAELARLQGDAEALRQAAAKALELDPKNADAWYALGRLETEREFVAAARDALKRAIALNSNGPGYQGELATLDTFANEFEPASRAFEEVLSRQPDDYVALTGLGVLQLKRGETEAALESFLKAGVIEPRYARAWLFTGVAHYQLGDRGRALEAFGRAAKLDDKDPLPHLVASLVYYDRLELGRAIEAAREAQSRMPNLKSLNQVLSDQKGSANLGSAMAAFGLEEWSQAYAYDSYSPYWAGSHLFLSDRFSGTYNRNSELFKGFLSDPAVFGASNRYSSLVPVPGHYASVGATATRDYITDASLGFTANGYSVSQVPFSYFIGADKTKGDSPINRTDADGRMRADGENLVLGLGLRPTHELGLFAFGNVSTYGGKIADRASGLTDDNFDYDYRRFDFGLNYKFSPVSHAWLKIGTGSEELPVSGAFFSPATANALNAAFATTIFQPGGQLNSFRSDLSQRDVQFRHTFDASPALQLSWGAEYAESAKPFVLSVEFLPLRIHLNQDNRIESGTAYLSGRYKFSEAIETQLDLHYQDTKTSFATDQQVEVVGVGVFPVPRMAGETHYRELNPRLGLKWKPEAAQTVRLAAQVWRKPAAVNTLAPVDTVGIPLDDRIERDGGRLKRARVQHDLEWGRAAFFQWYLDYKDINNPDAAGAGIVPDLQLDQLEKLRNRRRVYTIRPEYLEADPKFSAGRVESAGLAFNRLLSREVTLAGRYVFAETENTGRAFNGRELPYHPQHYVNLALNWQPYARWVVGPVATWRDTRFADEANLMPLSAGWSAGLGAYWESEDKRWSAAAVVDQLHSDKQSSIYRHATALLQAIYRF